MGWSTEDGRHEGWAAAEMPDGRLSVGSASGRDGVGALVRRVGPGIGAWDDAKAERGVVDGRAAIGWRGLCECGWRGPLWARVDSAGQADANGHRVYAPDPGVYGDAPEAVEEAIRTEWREHLAPEQTLEAVRQEARAVAAAQARLTAAVEAARAAGASWADVGAAAGVARQSAHERWGRRAGTASAR
jgi:hypothetical protein